MEVSDIVEILHDIYPDSEYEIGDILYQDFNKMTYHAENSNKKDQKICKLIFAYNISPQSMYLYSASVNIVKNMQLEHITPSSFIFDGFQMILYTTREYTNFVVDKCLDPSLLPLTDLFIDVIYGIRSIHSCGLLSGNISPSNVLFDEDYKFSLCDSFENYLWPNNKIPAIKYRYISPEILNEKEPTEMCDIWSYGCLVYYCLTGGKNAFNGNNSDELPLSIINSNFDMLNEYDNSDLYIPIIKGALNIKSHERMNVNEIILYLEALNNKEDIIPYNTVDNINNISYIDLLYFHNFYFSSLRFNNIDFPYCIIEYVLNNENDSIAAFKRFVFGDIKSITDYVVYIRYHWSDKKTKTYPQINDFSNPISRLRPFYFFVKEHELYLPNNCLNPSYENNVKFLSYSFFAFKQMTVLGLNDCGINLEGLKILTKEFKCLESLEILDVSNNHLTNESCLVLSEGIKYLKNLEKIMLYNDFDDIGFAYLKEQLNLLTKLSFIGVDYPGMSNETIEFVKRINKKSGDSSKWG